MRKRVIAGALLGCLWPAHICLGQETHKLVLSLADAERLALRNNPVMKGAATELGVSRVKRAQASHARFLPKFTVRNIWGTVPRARGEFTETGVLVSPDTSTGLNDLRYFTQVDVDLVQPIWTFGQLRGLNRAAESGVEAAEAGVVRSKEDLRLKVRKAYWGLVLGYELLSVVDDMMEEAADAQSRLQELFDEGSDEVSQNDLFKFQIFQYQIQKSRRQTLDQIELGKAALRATVGLDEVTDFTLATTQLDPLVTSLDSLETYTAMALANRPELDQLRAGINARSSLVGVEKSNLFPQFFVAANIKFNQAPSRFDSKNPFVYNPTNFFRPGIVVGLNWNLNFFQTRDQMRLARYDLARVAEQELPLMKGIRLDVRKSYLAVKQADANIEESRRALKASDNWLRAETQTFDLGIGEVKDVIDAFRANATMKREYLENIFEFNTALASLSKAVGRDLYPN